MRVMKNLLRPSLRPPGVAAAVVAEPGVDEAAAGEVEEAVEAEEVKPLLRRNGRGLREIDHLAMLHLLFP